LRPFSKPRQGRADRASGHKKGRKMTVRATALEFGILTLPQMRKFDKRFSVFRKFFWLEFIRREPQKGLFNPVLTL
jgi:hypothetical protein